MECEEGKSYLSGRDECRHHLAIFQQSMLLILDQRITEAWTSKEQGCGLFGNTTPVANDLLICCLGGPQRSGMDILVNLRCFRLMTIRLLSFVFNTSVL